MESERPPWRWKPWYFLRAPTCLFLFFLKMKYFHKAPTCGKSLCSGFWSEVCGNKCSIKWPSSKYHDQSEVIGFFSSFITITFVMNFWSNNHIECCLMWIIVIRQTISTNAKHPQLTTFYVQLDWQCLQTRWMLTLLSVECIVLSQ